MFLFSSPVLRAEEHVHETLLSECYKLGTYNQAIRTYDGNDCPVCWQSEYTFQVVKNVLQQHFDYYGRVTHSQKLTRVENQRLAYAISRTRYSTQEVALDYFKGQIDYFIVNKKPFACTP